MKAEKEHIDELIVSYLSNELDGNAVHELKEWIAASVENEKYFMQRQEIWFSAISDMKNSIYNKDEAFQLFRKRVDTYQKNKMMRKRLIKENVKISVCLNFGVMQLLLLYCSQFLIFLIGGVE